MSMRRWRQRPSSEWRSAGGRSRQTLRPQSRAKGLWSRRKRALAAVLAITLLAGCASERLVVAESVALPVPVRPVLPVIEPVDLECLGDAAYEALVTRDAMLQAHVRRLEAVIGTTHEKHQEH